jgi:hypothetical protein
MITRRNFIEMLGLTTVGAASLNLTGKVFAQTLESGDLFSLPSESLSDPVLSFTSAHFTPFVNTDFEVTQAGANRTETLKLLNVKEAQRKANLAKGIQGNSFSLMFSAARETKFVADRFDFNHPSLGAFTLILMPVSAEPNRYEAVINHLWR